MLPAELKEQEDVVNHIFRKDYMQAVNPVELRGQQQAMQLMLMQQQQQPNSIQGNIL